MYDIYYNPEIQRRIKALDLGIPDYPWAIKLDKFAILAWSVPGSRACNDISGQKCSIHSLELKYYNTLKGSLKMKYMIPGNDGPVLVGHIIEFFNVVKRTGIVSTFVTDLLNTFDKIAYSGEIGKYSDNQDILEKMYSHDLNLIIADQIRDYENKLASLESKIRAFEKNELLLISKFSEDLAAWTQKAAESRKGLYEKIDALCKENKELKKMNNNLLLIQNKVNERFGMTCHKTVFDDISDLMHFSFRGLNIPDNMFSFIDKYFKDTDGYTVYYLSYGTDIHGTPVSLVKTSATFLDDIPDSGLVFKKNIRRHDIDIAFLKLGPIVLINMDPKFLGEPLSCPSV